MGCPRRISGPWRPCHTVSGKPPATPLFLAGVVGSGKTTNSDSDSVTKGARMSEKRFVGRGIPFLAAPPPGLPGPLVSLPVSSKAK